MNSSRALLLVALVIGAGAVSYFARRASPDDWQAPRVVTIESDEKLAALTPSWVSWLSDAEPAQKQALLLRDGDYLGGDTIGFRYANSDGAALKLTFNEWSIRLGETTVAVMLSEAEGRAWLNSASAAQLTGLRGVEIPSELDAETLASLKRLGAANPGVDLAVKAPAVLQQVLPLFQPRSVFVTEGATGDLSALANQGSIEELLINASEPGNLAVLATMPKLSRLILGGWDIAKAGALPSGLSALRTLIVIDADDMKDLSPIRNVASNLEELSLLGLQNLTSLAGIERFSGLRALVLSGTEGLSDLSALAAQKQLRWVGLPKSITQEQFVAFTKAHPNLEILDLMGTEHVTELASLSTLKQLRGVVLDGPYSNLDPIRSLTSLQFVGIAKKTWDASPDQVAAIRKALPDAIVVRVSPLCLGSGWILLPVLILAACWWLRRQPRQANAPLG
jgi:hypothetical protein